MSYSPGRSGVVREVQSGIEETITLWAYGYRDAGGEFEERALTIARLTATRALADGHDVHSAFEAGRLAYFDAVAKASG